MSFTRQNTAHAIGWYRVYVAMEFEDLFLPENMAYEYNYLRDGSC